jgi:hypothetical protein
MFDVQHEESFFNLSKWHTDVLSYCKSQTDKFAIVLVGIKNNHMNKNSLTSSFTVKRDSAKVSAELIEQFQVEKEFVIGYCEVDLDDETNLNEPFAMLFEHMNRVSESRALSPNNFNEYFVHNHTNYNNNTNYSYVGNGKIKLENIDDDDDQVKNKKKSKKCCNIL